MLAKEPVWFWTLASLEGTLLVEVYNILVTQAGSALKGACKQLQRCGGRKPGQHQVGHLHQEQDILSACMLQAGLESAVLGVIILFRVVICT